MLPARHDRDTTAIEAKHAFHGDALRDYQGRSWTRPNLGELRPKVDDDHDCFIPKRCVHKFTGHGKGKTTASLGLALRTLGHGHQVAVVQFIKGGWEPGEAKALKAFGDALSWHALGEGFTWETQDRERDRQLVQAAWDTSLSYLRDPKQKLVVLDEVNVALKLGYLELDQVLQGLDERPELTHVALTGRGAPDGLIQRADLVTEMSLVKHPFREQGVKAQQGIEF